jgi:hypothetical protein
LTGRIVRLAGRIVRLPDRITRLSNPPVRLADRTVRLDRRTDPEHAILRPKPAEIKRLKKVALGKKPASQDPAPTPTPSAPAEKL